MIQIVTQNSVLSQNWAECTVYTPMAQAAHAQRPDYAHSAVSWCTRRRVVVMPGRVAARTGCVSGCVTRARCRVVAPFSQATKIISRPKPCLAPCCARCRACRSVPASCRRVLLRSIAASGTPCCDARPAPPVMIQSFVS